MNTKQDNSEPLPASDLFGLLGDKHDGMRVSASGAISNSARALKAVGEKGLAWSLEELSKHLHELGERFYAGDVKVVDEFLQLYCLADTRPNKQLAN